MRYYNKPICCNRQKSRLFKSKEKNTKKIPFYILRHFINIYILLVN